MALWLRSHLPGTCLFGTSCKRLFGGLQCSAAGWIFIIHYPESRPFGNDFPIKTVIPRVWSQWGPYNLPRSCRLNPLKASRSPLILRFWAMFGFWPGTVWYRAAGSCSKKTMGRVLAIAPGSRLPWEMPSRVNQKNPWGNLLGRNYEWKYESLRLIETWLVVYLPLWKIYEFVNWVYSSQHMGK